MVRFKHHFGLDIQAVHTRVDGKRARDHAFLMLAPSEMRDLRHFRPPIRRAQDSTPAAPASNVGLLLAGIPRINGQFGRYDGRIASPIIKTFTQPMPVRD